MDVVKECECKREKGRVSLSSVPVLLEEKFNSDFFLQSTIIKLHVQYLNY